MFSGIRIYGVCFNKVMQLLKSLDRFAAGFQNYCWSLYLGPQLLYERLCIAEFAATALLSGLKFVLD